MPSHQPNPFASGFNAVDRHVIQTPEQIDLHFQVAGIGSRFLAIAIDTLIQMAAGAMLALVLPFAFRKVLPRLLPGVFLLWAAAVLIVFLFLVYFGYFALFEIFWNGQTPGKRVLGIRVLKESGRPLNALEAIARNLMRIVDQLPGFYGVAIVTAMLNQQSKRLGDFVAGSIVVRDNSFSGTRIDWSPPGTEVVLAPLGANLLTLEDAALIEAFLARRHDLAPGVRHRMAQEILKRVQPKLPASSGVDTQAEALLVSIFDEYRSNAPFTGV